MNPKSVIQISMIVFLVLILYLLGTRIIVNVGKVREIQEKTEPPSIPPAETILVSPSPAPVYLEPQGGLLGPYGYLTDEMIKNMDNYPHKNPMMYKKRERILLNNLVE